jgi:transcriptional regulator with XRE-family HTH domain
MNTITRHELRLRVWLIKSGMTQTALAKKVGTSQPFLSEVLQGKRIGLKLRERLINEVGMPREIAYGAITEHMKKTA